MAGRIRTIKPELLEDKKTAGLSDAAFRIFVAAILLADDYGNFRAEPAFLEGQIYWAIPDAPSDVRLALGELSAAGLVEAYCVRGQAYASVVGWSKHQRMDNAGKPRVPGPLEKDGLPNFAASRRESPQLLVLAPLVRGSTTDHRPPTTTTEQEQVTAADRPPTSIQATAEAIGKHRVFLPLDAVAIAEAFEPRRVTAGLKVNWVVDSIAQCAEKSAGLGLNREALQAKLLSFMRNAKPRHQPEPANEAWPAGLETPAERETRKHQEEQIRLASAARGASKGQSGQ